MTNPFQAVTTEAGRYYPRNGKQYISVTTALNGLPKDALPQWAANKAADKAIELLGNNCDPVERWMRDEMRYAHVAEKEAAGALGDAVHGYCENIVLHGLNTSVAKLHAAIKESDGVKVANRVRQFCKWYERFDIEPMYVEATVYNDTHLYAGSCDLMARVDGVPTILDYKTSKGVYGSVALQLAAYRYADVIVSDDGRELPLPTFDRAAVLHIKDRTIKFIEVAADEAAFQHFLNVLRVKREWLDGAYHTALLSEIEPVN